MIRMYERIALITAGGLVSGLIAAAVLFPPDKTTARPNGVFEATAVAPAPHPKRKLQAQRFLPIKARGSETLLAGVNVRALNNHRPVRVNSAENLDKTFTALGYDLDSVRSGHRQVPRLFLASMPSDLGDLQEVSHKKTLFFKTVLPLILQVNQEILADRSRLWDLQTRRKKGEKLGPVDRLWLIVMAERYKLKSGDISGMLVRADIIPVSLALAQAAEESGWGTSRFVREGNAMFGQWTTAKDEGLVPEKRDAGKSHKVKAFNSLLDSARAYARNLNTHRAYRKLRTMRHRLRQKGEAISGTQLVETLTRYSERGKAYVKGLRAIIAVNKLKHLDGAKLNTDA